MLAQFARVSSDLLAIDGHRSVCLYLIAVACLVIIYKNKEVSLECLGLT